MGQEKPKREHWFSCNLAIQISTFFLSQAAFPLGTKVITNRDGIAVMRWAGPRIARQNIAAGPVGDGPPTGLLSREPRPTRDKSVGAASALFAKGQQQRVAPTRQHRIDHAPEAAPLVTIWRKGPQETAARTSSYVWRRGPAFPNR
jgi:hypothetical protein